MVRNYDVITNAGFWLAGTSGVPYLLVWVENNYFNPDDYKKEENNNSISNSQIFKPNKNLLLHIQMELCLMSLKELMNKLNNELNQKWGQVITLFRYYIASELSIEILESVDYLHKQK